jgi:osmotically-inducible protein OsmY
MRGEGKFIGGVLIGLGLAYLLDPDRGARRRALVRDKAVSAGHKLADSVEATASDLRNRAGGAAAELRSRIKREAVGDDVLHERVRAAIGHAVSHPGALTVLVQDGRVTLQGQVLERELDDLLRSARRVRGVTEVVNELEVHPVAGNVPALQGPDARDG